jgi:hypothetical protein
VNLSLKSRRRSIIYLLSKEEFIRFERGIRATLATPFIDDLEDFVWEAVFSYIKNLPLIDPLTTIRSKRLFDVVDAQHQIGWSAKALQWAIYPGCEFELVIQRADIFKKYQILGFSEGLTLTTNPQVLGAALLQHWYTKVKVDALAQNVTDMRVCILLKSRDRRRFAFYENKLEIYQLDELEWRWTNETSTGLQGVRKSDSFVVFRWYPNQKQLFERFKLPENVEIIQLPIARLSLDETIQALLESLDRI